MNEAEINTQQLAIDPVAQDFKTAVFIVSLFANLAIFTTWLAFALI